MAERNHEVTRIQELLDENGNIAEARLVAAAGAKV